MPLKNLLAKMVLVLSILLPGAAHAADEPILGDGEFNHLYSICIENVEGGEIYVLEGPLEARYDVGKVLIPVSAVNDQGYTASKWAQPGEVAATAVNAIHIKTGQNLKDDKGIIFSLLPREMSEMTEEQWKSYLSASTSLFTDIPASRGIFGGGWAPFTGNSWSVVRDGEELRLLEGEAPMVGDLIRIDVEAPARYPLWVRFENRENGLVWVKFSGEQEQAIARVMHPVGGTGRFGGSLYIGPGRIRANHNGVICVSTSPAGKVGGFQIIPDLHSHSPEMQHAWEMTQWMIIGPVDPESGTEEAAPPFFKYFLQPAKPDIMDPEISAQKVFFGTFLVLMKREGSAEWELLPRVEGREDEALKDIAEIKISFPEFD